MSPGATAAVLVMLIGLKRDGAIGRSVRLLWAAATESGLSCWFSEEAVDADGLEMAGSRVVRGMILWVNRVYSSYLFIIMMATCDGNDRMS